MIMYIFLLNTSHAIYIADQSIPTSFFSNSYIALNGVLAFASPSSLMGKCNCEDD